MQQCPTCGSLNPDNADVCADCGMELPGQGASASAAPATPAPATPAEAAPASTPEAPTPAPFDFAPESAASPAPDESGAAPTPAPVEAAGSDPFAGNDWNFDLNKGDAASGDGNAQATPEGATPAVETPAVGAAESLPTDLGGVGATPATTPDIPTPVTPLPPIPVPTAPSGAATGSAKLILKRGGAPTGDVFSIGPNATVGRFDPESGPVDVDMAQLPESVYISRHHAEINLRDGQWLVKDLGSRNGTFVKNAAGFARVTGETPIANGDEVAFGNARFEFQTA